MLSKIKNWIFSKKKSRPLVRVKERTKLANKIAIVSEFDEQSQTALIEDIFSAKIDGVILKKAVLDSTLQRVKDNISEWNYTSIRKFRFGECLGQDLLSTNGDLNLYLSELEGHNKGLNHLFGENQVAFLMRALQGLSKVKIEPFPDGSGSTYKPAMLRVIRKNSGFGIDEHIGNEFITELPACKHLKDRVHSNAQLSFFVLIQKPEIGGELELFDLVWGDTPKHLVEDCACSKRVDERSEYLARKEKFTVPMEEGDMVIFDGGRIWHRVNKADGLKDRITFGGFLGLTLENDKIHIWA